MKRWAVLLRSVGWLAGGLAAVALVVAVAWVLFVPVADWLAHHDVGSAKAPLLQTSRDAARGRLLTLSAGLFAAGALVFTARNFRLSRESQVTDRYTKAIEQIGSDKLDVRIGGIYALERIARDSARDHPTVMEVLTAFVRAHSREPWPLPAADEPDADAPIRETRPDVQAAVTVIGRRTTRYDRQRVNLKGADLAGADLTGTILAYATLIGAILAGADLSRADLAFADLADADLTGANLYSANLTAATLIGADLAGARLDSANLAYADFSRVDLTSVDLIGAFIEPEAVIPAGLQRDASSGQLQRANTDFGATETN